MIYADWTNDIYTDIYTEQLRFDVTLPKCQVFYSRPRQYVDIARRAASRPNELPRRTDAMSDRCSSGDVTRDARIA